MRFRCSASSTGVANGDRFQNSGRFGVILKRRDSSYYVRIAVDLRRLGDSAVICIRFRAK